MDISKPLVSVVIPTYNRKEYVKQAISSVLNQSTIFEFEIIVVDDGSTDGTCSAVQEFGENVRFFSQTNRGVSSARNFGVTNSKGTYVAFLDSDDLMIPSRLQSQVDFLNKYDDVGLVAGNYSLFDSNIGVIENRHFDHSLLGIKKNSEGIVNNFYVNSIKVNNPLFCTALVRRNLFLSLKGFDEELIKCEDFELSARIAAVAKIGIIDKPLVLVRHQGHERLSTDPRFASQPSPSFYEKMIDVWLTKHSGIIFKTPFFKAHIRRWVSAVAMQNWAIGKRTEIFRLTKKYRNFIGIEFILKATLALCISYNQYSLLIKKIFS